MQDEGMVLFGKVDFSWSPRRSPKNSCGGRIIIILYIVLVVVFIYK